MTMPELATVTFYLCPACQCKFFWQASDGDLICQDCGRVWELAELEEYARERDAK